MTQPTDALTPLWVYLLISTALIMLPTGIGLAFYYDEARWLLISAVALVFFLAG